MDQSMIPQRPVFLEGTFLWQVSGYRLASTPPRDLTDPLALEDNDPWVVVAASLERAKRGDFLPLPRLTHVMKQYSDAALWGAYSILLGFAGFEILRLIGVQIIIGQIDSGNKSERLTCYPSHEGIRHLLNQPRNVCGVANDSGCLDSEAERLWTARQYSKP